MTDKKFYKYCLNNKQKLDINTLRAKTGIISCSALMHKKSNYKKNFCKYLYLQSYRNRLPKSISKGLYTYIAVNI